MNQIYFVDRKKKSEVDMLRTQAYQNASGFSVDVTTLEWKASDDESFVMGAESDNQLISTMRGEFITDLTLLEQKLECPWHYPLELEMPILLLSRAATLSSHRAGGFNLMLRYWFLRFAIHHNIQFVIGTFVSGSPRENTLREMGYQFFENELGWQQSTYRSLRPVTVVALNLRTHGEHALQYCLANFSDSLRDFQFTSDFPNLRFVRSI
jgi:hypothetical protein